MTTQAEPAAEETALTSDQVAAYLRAHPNFLVDRDDDLLTELELPHRAGAGTVSLIERQVGQLRQRNERLEQRLADLLHTARENQRVGDRLLALARGLLQADSLDDVLALVREMLQTEFTADDAVILLVAPDSQSATSAADSRFRAIDDPVWTPFQSVLADTAAICGELDADQRQALFGDRAETIASAALVPLRSGWATGLIGVGSRDPAHFRADMGTLFLDRLGELVSTGVACHAESG